MFVALGLVLPFLTGQIPEIGKMLSPMHIPILLCGFICGIPFAGIAGFITPLLRAVLFGMPALFPNAVGMAFELMTYGMVSGALYPALKKRLTDGKRSEEGSSAGHSTGNRTRRLMVIYAVLIISMLAGRLVWGLVSLVLYGIAGNQFTIAMFIAGAFTGAIPGIILHLIVIPPLVMALERITVRNRI